MDKEELIKKIDLCIITEEMAVPVYGRHLKTALFWSGLGKKRQKYIRNCLDVIIRDTKRHKEILESLKIKIMESE